MGIEQEKLADILKDVKEYVEQGGTFSDGLARHPKLFDELFVNLVRAGEMAHHEGDRGGQGEEGCELGRLQPEPVHQPRVDGWGRDSGHRHGDQTVDVVNTEMPRPLSTLGISRTRR